MTGTIQANKSWINIARLGAILGVLIQHTKGYCYNKDKIFYSVWWAVALFVLLGGYNAYSSYLKRGSFHLREKLIRILIPYAFAAAVYNIWDNRFFDAVTYLSSLLHFDATGPMYYVAAYVQLLVITPVLIGAIRFCREKRPLLRYPILWAIVLGFCYLSSHFTNLFDIAIGGGYLFAGPWLFFWFCGMFIRHLESLPVAGKFDRRFMPAAFIVLTAAIIVWQYQFVHLGRNFEYKSLFLASKVGMTWPNALETVLIFFWFMVAVGLFVSVTGDTGKKILRPFGFLYHMLFLSIYQQFLEIPHFVNRFICFAFILVVPAVLGGYFLPFVKRGMAQIMAHTAAR